MSTPRAEIDRLLKMPGSQPDIDALIEKHAAANFVDPDLVRRIIHQESGGKRNVVSPKGAGGLMQLMPATAKGEGVTNVFDADQNIGGGTRYLKKQLDRFGDVNLALAAYNAGPEAVARRGNRVPPYTETKNYVKRIAGGYTGTGYHPTATPQGEIDAALGLSPTGETEPTYQVAPFSPSNEGENPAQPPQEPQQFLKSPEPVAIAPGSATPVAPNAAPMYKPPVPPKDAQPASEFTSKDTYDVPLKPFDKEQAGALGVIGNAGPEAQAGYIDWVRRNATGKHEASLTDEAYAQTFVKIQQYLGANPKATPEETVKEFARLGTEFVADPATKGKQLPKTLHDAMLRAPYSEDELKTLPSKIRQQREQIARADRQRQQEAALQKQTIDLYKKDPDKLNQNIAWHFGAETLAGIANLPEKVQRHVALMAVAAANEDDRKRAAGQTDFQQDAQYQATMRKKAGISDEMLVPTAAPRQIGEVQDMQSIIAAAKAQGDTRTPEQINDAHLMEQATKNVSGFTASPSANIMSLFRAATKGKEGGFEADVQEEFQRLKDAQARSQTPEMIAARKRIGSVPDTSGVMPGMPSVRGVASAAQRFAGGAVKEIGGAVEASSIVTGLGGIADALGVNPIKKIQNYLNQRGNILEESASMPMDAQGQAIERSLPEKATDAVTSLGLTVAQLVLLKKATGLNLGPLMAIEATLKNSDAKIGARAIDAVEAYGMGAVLDQHLSRPLSAALFGGPTAVESTEQYAKGNMSLEDAILNTAVQAGAGFILGGKRGEASPTGEKPTEVSDAKAEPILKPGRPADQPYNAGADEPGSIGGRSEPAGIRKSPELAESTRTAPAQTAKTEDVPRQQTVAREDIDRVLGYAEQPNTVVPAQNRVAERRVTQGEPPSDSAAGNQARIDELQSQYISPSEMLKIPIAERSAITERNSRINAEIYFAEGGRLIPSSERVDLYDTSIPLKERIASLYSEKYPEFAEKYAASNAPRPERRIAERRTTERVVPKTPAEAAPRTAEATPTAPAPRESTESLAIRPSSEVANVPEMVSLHPVNKTQAKVEFTRHEGQVSDAELKSLFPDYEVTVRRIRPFSEGRNLQSVELTFWEKGGTKQVAVPEDLARRFGLKSAFGRQEEPQLVLSKEGVSPMGETEGIARVNTSDLALDPNRFQYKLNKDAKGSTGSLKGVEKWNDEFAGLIQVWKDPADGKTYIVNGHNRYNKAIDTGQGEVNVQYIKADSTKEARAAGALSNIASGDGTPMDAAQFFRDSGKGADDLKGLGISLESDIAKEGLALSNLNDFVFNAVRRGELPEEQGIAIGAKVKNPDLQNQAFKALAKAAEKKTLSKGVVDEILDAVTAAPRAQETDQTLFGDVTSERSLFTERAQVSAAIKRMLTGDKSLFGTAARKSERLAEGGTQVDVEKAKELQDTATEALGIFDTLKNRSGKVSDILDAGARKVASGERPDKIAKEAYEQIKQAVNETLGRGTEKGAQGGGATPDASSREEGARGVGGEPEEGLKFGPGAANVGDVPQGRTIEQLTEAISKLPKGKSANERAAAVLDAADKISAGKDKLHQTWARAVAFTQAQFVRPEVTDYKKAVGDFTYAVQRSGAATREFVKQIHKTVPSKLRREAIVNFIQADEDANLLMQRAQQSNPRRRLGYEEATRLTDEEKTVARLISSAFESNWQEANKKGMVHGFIENYMPQVWKRSNPITQRMTADIQRSQLDPSFKFSKQRVFESYFEGEQAGYKPANKDAGDLFAIWNRAMNKAIYSRQMIEDMHTLTATDGRPLAEISGSGMVIERGDQPESAFLRPFTKQADIAEQSRRKKAREESLNIADYQPVDHPALRGFKWVTKVERPRVDENGEVEIDPKTGEPKKDFVPVYMQGNMLVHPDAYNHLKNMLGKSWFYTPGTLPTIARGVMKTEQAIKGTMFGLVSQFHLVQEGTHGLGHRVNVFNLPKIDWDNPVDSLLIKRGMMVAHDNAAELFGEGVASGNLLTKIPVLGNHIIRPYQDWLFQDYIPRLKMEMGRHAFERNTKRYGSKLSVDQIAEMTAEQANAAFGELNYEYMGRNKSYQDVLRTFLLAPDFLEARGRFVAQAIKPELTDGKLTYHGTEQLAALGLLAATQYVGARILNKFSDGDYHWEPENAFKVIHKGRWYGMRTVPGDIIHLVSDPRSFFFNRLSPVVSAGVEAATGRDDRGQKKDAAEQIKDFLKRGEPIQLRRHSDDSWWESFANSMGLQEGRYYTPAEEVIKDYYNEKFPGGFPKSSDPERAELKKQLVKKERAGQDTEDDILRLADEGKLSRDDVKQLFKKGQIDSLQASFIPLPLSVAVTAFEKADKDQRAKLRSLLAKKVRSGLKKLPAAERDALRERIDKVLE